MTSPDAERQGRATLRLPKQAALQVGNGMAFLSCAPSEGEPGLRPSPGSLTFSLDVRSLPEVGSPWRDAGSALARGACGGLCFGAPTGPSRLRGRRRARALRMASRPVRSAASSDSASRDVGPARRGGLARAAHSR
jgi:hypothetical protein